MRSWFYRWLPLALAPMAFAPAAARGQVGARHDAVIYGADDRSDASLAVAEALAALVPAERLAVEAERVSMRPTTLAERLGGPLCEGERFIDVPSLADCSAVLVAPDAVLTAAHCVPDAAACDRLRVVFGFRRDGETLAALDAADVHRCVGREDASSDLDRVRLRLDRASDRTPLRLGRAEPGDQVTVAGHPAGGPALAETVRVDRRQGEGFVLYADVEAGSSGSPVSDLDGVLVGVLVAGEGDYEWRGDCFGAPRLPTGEGEGAWAADVLEPGGCSVASGGRGGPLSAILLALPMLRARRRSRRRGASADCGPRPRSGRPDLPARPRCRP